MKNTKLEKKTAFIFKRKAFMNLTKDQMRTVIGGNNPTDTVGQSTQPGCVEDKTTVGTVSL
ncbi:hypothetical protein [Pedobacter zeae]|uniref:Uncharacterized protein n=1 Tax=Pedobacter zeae TaxID=1737356 RepID=A0A7W6K7L6_9SPHI|nr:hypothetical protein [Pedobacter zeae]MBB4106708.1 hypothetical protein [Pedobacter zeae]GGH03267.1 hypothetical protein GCM10007422_18210 [Pedobacter zeae]